MRPESLWLEELAQRWWWIGICPTCQGIFLHIYDSAVGRQMLETLAQGLEMSIARLLERGIVRRVSSAATPWGLICTCPTLGVHEEAACWKRPLSAPRWPCS